MSNQPANPIIKPSDAVSWVSCARRVWLDNRNGFEFESTEDEFEQLVIELGLAHENKNLKGPCLAFCHNPTYS